VYIRLHTDYEGEKAQTGKLPPGIELVKADDLQEWQVDIRVLDANPLYMNQTYRLSFIFNNNYPIGKSSNSEVNHVENKPSST
jgi:ubiquitin-conjugating enzyme E2 W